MSSFSSTARENRLKVKHNQNEMISRRQYNGILCGTLLYGLIVNMLLCVFVKDITTIIDPVLFLILYFVCAFAGIFISIKSDNPIISFIGYNMVVVPVGLVISMCVTEYGGLTSDIVVEAFLITMCITASMTVFAILKPEWCRSLGGFLFPCLLGLVLAELTMLLFGYQNILTSWVAAILFTLYIAYDVYRSQQFEPTIDNAIDCALDIYLDIANLFVRVLEILGKKK